MSLCFEFSGNPCPKNRTAFRVRFLSDKKLSYAKLHRNLTRHIPCTPGSLQLRLHRLIETQQYRPCN